jgi:hypothetical protein
MRLPYRPGTPRAAASRCARNTLAVHALPRRAPECTSGDKPVHGSGPPTSSFQPGGTGALPWLGGSR